MKELNIRDEHIADKAKSIVNFISEIYTTSSVIVICPFYILGIHFMSLSNSYLHTHTPHLPLIGTNKKEF